MKATRLNYPRVSETMGTSVFYESATSKMRAANDAERHKPNNTVPPPIENKPLPMPGAAAARALKQKTTHFKAPSISVAPSEAVLKSATVQFRENRRMALNIAVRHAFCAIFIVSVLLTSNIQLRFAEHQCSGTFSCYSNYPGRRARTDYAGFSGKASSFFQSLFYFFSSILTVEACVAALSSATA